MPTKEEDFKQRFAGILLDVRGMGSDDVEGMWLVGSLAARIVDHASRKSWTQFKEKLTRTDCDALIRSFQNQGSQLAAQGAHRQVHAVQILAASLVAKTQVRDAEIVAGDKILNRIIDDAIGIYRRAKTDAEPVIDGGDDPIIN